MGKPNAIGDLQIERPSSTSGDPKRETMQTPSTSSRRRRSTPRIDVTSGSDIAMTSQTPSRSPVSRGSSRSLRHLHDIRHPVPSDGVPRRHVTEQGLLTSEVTLDDVEGELQTRRVFTLPEIHLRTWDHSSAHLQWCLLRPKSKARRQELERKLKQTSVVYRRRLKKELGNAVCMPRRLRMREFTEFPYPAAPDPTKLPPLPPPSSKVRGSYPTVGLVRQERPSCSVALAPKPHLLRRPCVLQETPDPEVGLRLIRNQGNYLDLKPLISCEDEEISTGLYGEGYPLLLKRFFDEQDSIAMRRRMLGILPNDAHKVKRVVQLLMRERELQRHLAEVFPKEGDVDFDLPFTTELMEECFSPVHWPWYQHSMEELERKLPDQDGRRRSSTEE